MGETFWVDLPLEEALRLVEKALVRGGFASGERLDTHVVHGRDGRRCVTVLYGRYYQRIRARLVLAVTADDMEDGVRVHLYAAGSDGWDGGAAADLAGRAAAALEHWRRPDVREAEKEETAKWL